MSSILDGASQTFLRIENQVSLFVFDAAKLFSSASLGFCSREFGFLALVVGATLLFGVALTIFSILSGARRVVVCSATTLFRFNLPAFGFFRSFGLGFGSLTTHVFFRAAAAFLFFNHSDLIERSLVSIVGFGFAARFLSDNTSEFLSIRRTTSLLFFIQTLTLLFEFFKSITHFIELSIFGSTRISFNFGGVAKRGLGGGCARFLGRKRSSEFLFTALSIIFSACTTHLHLSIKSDDFFFKSVDLLLSAETARVLLITAAALFIFLISKASRRIVSTTLFLRLTISFFALKTIALILNRAH